VQLLDCREPTNARAKRFHALIGKKKKKLQQLPWRGCNTKESSYLNLHCNNHRQHSPNQCIRERVLLSPEDILINSMCKKILQTEKAIVSEL